MLRSSKFNDVTKMPQRTNECISKKKNFNLNFMTTETNFSNLIKIGWLLRERSCHR